MACLYSMQSAKREEYSEKHFFASITSRKVLSSLMLSLNGRHLCCIFSSRQVKVIEIKCLLFYFKSILFLFQNIQAIYSVLLRSCYKDKRSRLGLIIKIENVRTRTTKNS